ncbi:MAG: calcium/sodium antiporter [Zoogloeaceae bacterium]|nr:calcium/sodium antiporter [Zoogloeaceae bacterium]
MDIFFFILGLATLVGGAELLVRGASRLSLSFGISPLVVGLTVVAFGTSAPELAVSVQSAMTDRADIALGNVVGSNIMNILLILGTSALIVPLVVANQLIRQEVPVMIGVSLLLLALASDGVISGRDGLLFVALLAAYTVFLIRQSRRRNQERNEGCSAELPVRKSRDDHWAMQVLLVAAGLGLLALGAHWLVEAAVAFARHLGISEPVIGLTIVAIGTSFPEIATSLMAAVRGQRDIAVGNVVGSNIFNVAGVLGVSGLVAPTGIPVHASVLSFDLPVMIAVSLACLPIFFTGNRIARWEGVLFLGLYVAYLAYLVLAAQKHDALTAYGGVLAGFVLPIIAVTLLVVSWREWRAIASARRQEDTE